jgi:PAS domain S-box-containing protein
LTPPRTSPLILNVDDDEGGRYAVTHGLRRHGYEVLDTSSGREALELAAGAQPDLVLLDIHLPDIDGFEVCRRLKADPHTACIPVLHLSASFRDDPSRVKGLNSGADGYLVEPVDPEVLHATVNALLRMKDAERAQRLAAQEWRSTFEAMADGVAILDAQGKIIRSNCALGVIVGRPCEELIGVPWVDLFPAQSAEYTLQVRRQSDKRNVVERSYNGKVLRITNDLIRGENAEITGCVAIASDITEWSSLQEMLQHSQRLEGIGLLAAGVAHDFNNLLTGILGNASLAQEDAPASIAGYLRSVLSAGERAADLTRQLLAHAGKGPFLICSTDVPDLVRDLIPLIQAGIPRNVEIVLEFEPGVAPVEADAAQLRQVIMNLVINGAEAIGEVAGTVWVRVRAAHLEGADVARRYYAADQMVSGQFVAIEVTDTGGGMDEATQSRIFDPFFTTKILGRGLGLAGTLGIVRQHRGGIRVESAPGHGTTFEVVIPASVAKPAETHKDAVAGAPPISGSVLVIDDSDIVRNVARAVLERAGYRVTLAENGKRGVEIFSQTPDAFSIVLLDLSMPQMGGEEALGHLLRLRPNAKVLIVSGHGETEVRRKFGDSRTASFLQKPFSAGRLVQKIREVLELSPRVENILSS